MKLFLARYHQPSFTQGRFDGQDAVGQANQQEEYQRGQQHRAAQLVQRPAELVQQGVVAAGFVEILVHTPRRGREVPCYVNDGVDQERDSARNLNAASRTLTVIFILMIAMILDHNNHVNRHSALYRTGTVPRPA